MLTEEKGVNESSFKEKILTAGILIILIAGGFWFFTREDAPVSYMTADVQRGTLEKKVMSTGKLDALQKVDVGAQVNGQLQTLNVKEGDFVKKGDLLAVIDPVKAQNVVIEAEQTVSEIKARLKQAEAEYAFAQATYQRRLALSKTQVISKQDVDEARRNMDVQRAAIDTYKAQVARNQATLDTARNDLQYTNIRAPMDGVVTELKTLQGQTVIAMQQAPTILSLADLDTMLVKAEVSEADVVWLKPGQKATFSVLGAPDKSFSGVITDILPKPQKINDAIFYYARFEVPNPQHVLKLDMTAQVTIALENRENVLKIPLAALGKEISPTEYEVQVLVNNQPETRQVTLGTRNDVEAEVVKGLAEHEKVVTGIDDGTAG
ncbi:macrolide transporter subunit MacA [Morganella morganii]|uniref:Macrolide transporter subunit MacA n=1 Tax=Morganella morganii TaxID=582 RepID=A0A433ZVQ0_MORMO|nr:macrolide transporter subunit MacA [Morganella morganii]